MQQGPRLAQKFHNYAPLGFPQIVDNQSQRRSESFEDQILNYMSENKRTSNLHEQKFAELALFQKNTTMFQVNINASLKNLETQVWELALTMQNQSRDAFSIDTKIIQRTAWLIRATVG